MWTKLLLLTNSLSLAGLVTVWVTVQPPVVDEAVLRAAQVCQDELAALRQRIEAAETAVQRQSDRDRRWDGSYTHTPLSLPRFK